LERLGLRTPGFTALRAGRIQASRLRLAGLPALGIHRQRIGRYARSILMNGTNRAVQKPNAHKADQALFSGSASGFTVTVSQAA
jgi:hypothetical protein